MKRINLTDIKIGSALIIAAFVLQPISMIVAQNYIAPKIFNQGTESESSALGKSISAANLHLRGSENAKLFLVEYSDYECPFCQNFHNTAKSVFNESNGDIAWVYKHFPLSFHPNALPSAIASECVAKIGGNEKFWQFSDMLFASQNNLAASALSNHAKMLGIDMNQYNTCINDSAIKAKVEADQEEGTSFGVQGTPNTFLAKKVGNELVFIANINGAQPKTAVDALIAQHINTDPGSLGDKSFFGKVKNFLGL